MKDSFFGGVKISAELMGSDNQAQTPAYVQFALSVHGIAVVLPMHWRRRVGRLWLGGCGLEEIPRLPVGQQAWTEPRLFHYLICQSEEPC